MVIRLGQKCQVVLEVDTTKRAYEPAILIDVQQSGILELLRGESVSLNDPLLEGTKSSLIVKDARTNIFDAVNGNPSFQQMTADFGFKITKVLDTNGEDITNEIRWMHHDRMQRKAKREKKKG